MPKIVPAKPGSKKPTKDAATGKAAGRSTRAMRGLLDNTNAATRRTKKIALNENVTTRKSRGVK